MRQRLGIPDEAGCAIMEIEKWEGVIDRDALEPQPVLRAAFRWMRRSQIESSFPSLMALSERRSAFSLIPTSHELTVSYSPQALR